MRGVITFLVLVIFSSLSYSISCGQIISAARNVSAKRTAELGSPHPLTYFRHVLEFGKLPSSDPKFQIGEADEFNSAVLLKDISADAKLAREQALYLLSYSVRLKERQPPRVVQNNSNNLSLWKNLSSIASPLKGRLSLPLSHPDSIRRWVDGVKQELGIGSSNYVKTAGKVAVGLWFWTYGAFEIARQAYTRFYCQQAPIEEFISDLEKGLSDPEGFPQDGILSLAIQNKTQSLFIFFSYTGKGKDRSPLLLSFWEQR